MMAIKRYELKKCYVYDMPPNMYQPDQVKHGVQKVYY